MIQPLPSADPSRAVLPATSSSSCDCLFERVEAIWKAFLAIVESILSWCGEKIHGVGKSSELPVPPASNEKMFEARHQEDLRAEQTKMVEWFDRFSDPDWDRGFMPMTGKFFRTWIDLQLPLDKNIEKIRELTKEHHLLHMVANPHFTNDQQTKLWKSGILLEEPVGENATEGLLKLGANPNEDTLIFRYRPLHCAVYSGCFLAYRTLREYGADPLLPMQNPWKNNMTPIALAQRILSDRQPHTFFPWKFDSMIDKRDNELCALFPYALSKVPKVGTDETRDAIERIRVIAEVAKLPNNGNRYDFGSFEEIEQMLAYEEELVAPIKARLDTILGLTLPRPLVALIGEHLKYQVIRRNP